MLLANRGFHTALKLIPPGWFMLLGGIDLANDLLKTHSTTATQICMTLFLSAPFFIRRKWVYLVCGLGYVAIFGFMLVRLFVFLTQYVAGRHLPQPGLFFGLGFPFFLFSFTCGIAVVAMAVDLADGNLQLKDPFGEKLKIRRRQKADPHT